MGSSTWGRSAPLTDRRRGQTARQERLDDDDDLELEQWHQSHLGNLGYLVIFAVITLLTVLAFVPVWLVLQVQRAIDFFRPTR
jgi:uncharacterized membrane protein YdjX (TVP38/TMEM64 family)